MNASQLNMDPLTGKDTNESSNTTGPQIPTHQHNYDQSPKPTERNNGNTKNELCRTSGVEQMLMDNL